MRKRDILSSIFWMVFGAFFTIGGLHYGLIRQGIPGPGSFPFVIGLIVIGLSLLVFIQALMKNSLPVEKLFCKHNSFHKFVLTLISMVGYGIFLKPLGFIVTNTLFLIIAVAWIGREKWLVALMFSLLTTLIAYMVFNAMQVELPGGKLWKYFY